MKRIAFFGGSFDPPHRGHLAVAKAAADRFALDEVLFAPVASQPLKQRDASAAFCHRYSMVALASQSDPRFVPSLLDGPAHLPNYTVHALERLRSLLNSEAHIFTLLGADSWLEISRWHDTVRMLSLTDWIVAARPGFSFSAAERALPSEVRVMRIPASPDNSLELHHANGGTTHVYFLPELKEEPSATRLRQLLDAGQADSDWLPPPVAEYIHKTGLYRDKAAPSGIR